MIDQINVGKIRDLDELCSWLGRVPSKCCMAHGLRIKWKQGLGIAGSEMLKYITLPCEPFKLKMGHDSLVCTYVECPLPSRVLKLVKTLKIPGKCFGPKPGRWLQAFRNAATGYAKECCPRPLSALVKTYSLPRVIVDTRNPYSVVATDTHKSTYRQTAYISNHELTYEDLSNVQLTHRAYDVLAERYKVPVSWFGDTPGSPTDMLRNCFGRHQTHPLFIAFVADYNPNHDALRVIDSSPEGA